ncbi:hypothetical protein [Streptomyces albofaciens]|uniref:hypothetical protein n=1 Tax=Streptomyces albofaciens TaxID=66866 RepID=UPI00142F0DB8|nr:hypothetical protein [Streptomyces albofaciens]
MVTGATSETRRAAGRGLWLAVLLVALMHVVGCSHGPLADGSWRTDSLTAAGPVSAVEPDTATGQSAVRSSACDSPHHESQQCAGVDEPTRRQTDGGRGALLPPPPPGTGVEPRVLPVRGPPVQEPVRPSGAPQAMLQVWRS